MCVIICNTTTTIQTRTKNPHCPPLPSSHNTTNNMSMSAGLDHNSMVPIQQEQQEQHTQQLDHYLDDTTPPQLDLGLTLQQHKQQQSTPNWSCNEFFHSSNNYNHDKVKDNKANKDKDNNHKDNDCNQIPPFTDCSSHYLMHYY